MLHETFWILLAVLLGGIGAFGIIRFGAAIGLLDRPNLRSSHSRVTPKGGGIGILLAFCLAAIWFRFPLLVWIPAAVLSLLSFAGDRKDVSFRIRLCAQLLASGLAAWGISMVNPEAEVFNAAGIVVGLLSASFFIVATANMYNFMDGINGIAGISGVIAFSVFTFLGVSRGESPAWIWIAAITAAACIGFLPLNFPRARVFMGDVGSVLLGFLFAVFVVAWSRSLIDFFLFVSFLSPFFLDETLTLWARLKSGDNLTKPHRRHIYQILVNQMGYAHWKISFSYGVVQLFVSLGTLYFSEMGLMLFFSWIFLVTTLMAWSGIFIRRFEKER